MISLQRLLGRQKSPPNAPPPSSAKVAAPAELVPVGRPAENLSGPLLQALQMLLEGLPLDPGESAQPGAESKRAALLRRLGGELQAFDVLEIATDAVTAFEEDGRARRNRNDLEAQARPTNDTRAALAEASLQALQTLINGLPVPREQSNTEGNPAIAELLRRLKEPVVPGDILEIANDALSLLEGGGRGRAAADRPDQDQSGLAGEHAHLAEASLQALQMLLVDLPAQTEPAGNSKTQARIIMPQLVRRLEGPLSPPEVLAIAQEALTALEQDAKASRERQALIEEELRLSAEQAEMSNALRQGFQILIAGLPLSCKAATDELLQRWERTRVPADVVEVARQALETLIRDDEATPSRNDETEHQRQETERYVSLSNGLLESLQTLLSGLPLLNAVNGVPDAAMNHTIDELLRRLEGPLAPAELLAIPQDALRALRCDAEAARERGRQREKAFGAVNKPNDSEKALLQAMQMMLGKWPAQGGAGEERERVVDALLRRLRQPLLPFEIIEIASSALAAFERDAKAVAKSQEMARRKEDDQKAELSSAYLQGLRTVISGLTSSRAEDDRKLSLRDERVLAGLLRRLDEPHSPSFVLEVAKEALGTFSEDSKAIVARSQLEIRERQRAVSLLTDTIATLAAPKIVAIARLRRIEQQIECAPTPLELRTSVALLEDCLQIVIQSSPMADNPVAGIRAAKAVVVPEPDVQDPPVQPAGAALKQPVADAVDPGEPAPQPEPAEYAVVVVLDRENGIAKRFGEAARQSALRHIQQHLKDGLMPSDRLVRWKGAAFVASIKRVGTPSEVRGELTSLASINLPPVLDVDNHPIHLPITLSWAVFPQAQFASMDLLFKRVDEFVAQTCVA